MTDLHLQKNAAQVQSRIGVNYIWGANEYEQPFGGIIKIFVGDLPKSSLLKVLLCLLDLLTLNSNPEWIIKNKKRLLVKLYGIRSQQLSFYERTCNKGHSLWKMFSCIQYWKIWSIKHALLRIYNFFVCVLQVINQINQTLHKSNLAMCQLLLPGMHIKIRLTNLDLRDLHMKQAKHWQPSIQGTSGLRRMKLPDKISEQSKRGKILNKAQTLWAQACKEQHKICLMDQQNTFWRNYSFV